MAGSSGTYSLGGGQLSAPSEYLGYSGTGTFTQNGGNNGTNNSLALYLGGNPGSSGIYSLGGSGLVSASDLIVGQGGAGTFMQSGGTNSVGSLLVLGNNAGSNGTYNLGGSGQVNGVLRVRGLFRRGDLHADRRDQQRGQHSRSGQRRQRRLQPRAAAANCRPLMSTWAVPSREPSRSPAGPTLSAAPSISATVRPAARTTSMAACSSSRR